MQTNIKDCTLYHLDCLDYLKNTDDKIDVIITDPPYLYKEYARGNKGFDEKQENIDFIKSISSGFDYELIFDLLKQKQEKINIFIFCNDMYLPSILSYWQRYNKYQVNTLVWKKGGRPFGNTYLHDIEFIVHIRETGSIFNGQYKSRLFSFLSKREWGHPTEKPVYLLSELIKYGSNEGSTVLDIYMGSGSLAEACIYNNRKFIGIEKEKKFFDIAVKRVKSVYSQKILGV